MFNKRFNTENINVWVTSDLHMDHGNILSFCPNTRPFKSKEEMNKSLIEEWNSRVKNEDYILHLGDFCFKGVEVTEKFLSRLNGKKIMILGNHDKSLRNGIPVGKYGIVWKGDYLEINVDGVKLCLSHYPMLVWNNAHRGSLQLFGHCHGSLPEQKGRQMDVGYDSLGEIKNIKDVMKDLLSKDIYTPDHH